MPTRTNQPTAKYLRRREDALNAAARLLNQKGLKGMTRGDVATQIGIVETGIGYYFSSKRAMAAACFHRAIEARTALIAEASQEVSPRERVARLIRLHFNFMRNIASGEAMAVAVFDDVRALGDPGVSNAYVDMFRKARELLKDTQKLEEQRSKLNSRAHWLLQQMVWIDIWLPRYEPETYARAAARMIDIMLNGLSSTQRSLDRLPISVPGIPNHSQNDPRETFLVAATQLINEQGYHGASVDKISARLNLTKGAFYYHIDAKDDLVEICFERTTDVVRKTLLACDALACSAGDRLATAVSFLVDHQLQGDIPLLRAQTVSLPVTIRENVLYQFERRAVHFGSIVSDGVVDGSLRPVDVQIAAQMIAATLNGAAELHQWVAGPPTEQTQREFEGALFNGILS